VFWYFQSIFNVKFTAVLSWTLVRRTVWSILRNVSWRLENVCASVGKGCNDVNALMCSCRGVVHWGFHLLIVKVKRVVLSSDMYDVLIALWTLICHKIKQNLIYVTFLCFKPTDARYMFLNTSFYKLSIILSIRTMWLAKC